MTEEPTGRAPPDLAALHQQEGWTAIKRVRAQLAVHSLRRAMERVAREKEEEKADSVQAEEAFNRALARRIHFEKVATEYGDANSVTRGVFSRTGALYVTVGSSGEGRVWDTALPTSPAFCSELTALKSPSKICGVDVHPRVGSIPAGGPNIVTGSTNGELLVWTLLRGAGEQKCVAREGHSERINSVLFHEAGGHFLTSSYDKSWALWDARRLSLLLVQRGHEREIHASCLHPDQSLYFTGDLAGYGMAWDLRTGKGVYEVKHPDSLLCSRFHPNGFELAVAGKANVISVFDLRRKKELKRVPAHLKLISDLKYDEDGSFLASVSHDNSVRLWHGRSYAALPVELLEQHKLTSLDINDGRLAVTCIDRKWSMLTNATRWRHALDDPQ